MLLFLKSTLIMKKNYSIRTAVYKDISAISDIYNDEVKNGTATFDISPKPFSEWEVWFSDHNINNHPLIVIETDGKIAGYASLSSYREKEAYAGTTELSVYVAKDFRGRVFASALLSNLILQAKNDPRTHLIVSVITGGNEASIHLHKKFGFTYCGTIHEAGKKFGKFLNIDNYELIV